VDTLVHTRGKQTEDTPSGSRSHMRNPLFEEQGGIQTRAICLDFSKFNGEEPNGWIYCANQFFTYHQTLQDFTVLPTDQFRRYMIISSSVIFLPMSTPTDYVRRLYLRRWFPIPSVYRSEKQKNHFLMVLQTEFARQKKKIPTWNIPTDFYSVGDIVITDSKYPSVMTSVSVWNTNRICPSVNSSVSVEATVKFWQINSIGKSVGECLKYRPNSSVGKILGNSFFLNLFLKNYLGYII